MDYKKINRITDPSDFQTHSGKHFSLGTLSPSIYFINSSLSAPAASRHISTGESADEDSSDDSSEVSSDVSSEYSSEVSSEDSADDDSSEDSSDEIFE